MKTTPNFIQEIRHYARKLVRELDVLKGSFHDTGFSYARGHTLVEIDQHKVLNQAELSNILLTDKANVSRTVAGLLKEGYLNAEKVKHDNRQKLLTLTEKGKKAIEKIDHSANFRFASALEQLSDDEQKIVLQGMQLFGKALHRSRIQHDFEIRPVRPEDNEIVARIIREVMTEYACVGEGYSINDPEVDEIYEAYHNDRSAFFVLTRQSTVIGCGGIGPLLGGDITICELKKMYFLPEARGFGLGQKFISLCLEKARELGYQQCYLETVRRMWQANLVYEKIGFHPLEKPLGNTGHNTTEVWMVKPLFEKELVN